MGSRRCAALMLACGALVCGAARSSDLGAPSLEQAPYVWEPFDEIRAGVFAHNLIHDEDAPVDLSIEALSSPLAIPGPSNPSVSWLLQPRLAVGGMINTGGKTSYAFAGFDWRIPIFGKLFFEGELGGAVNDAVRVPTWDRVDMGCALTFRESGGFGLQMSENWDIIVSVEHVSHASFCGGTNPGLTNFGLRIGYAF